MDKLRDVMVYFCRKYPHKSELSKARLTKMIYLADWKSALEHGRQITNIKWEYNYFGPYVLDVIQLAEQDNYFEVIGDTNVFGERKDVIRCRREAPYDRLEKGDRQVLDAVIAVTEDRTWDEFIRLVYSTYPIKTQSQFSSLNLVHLAKVYKRLR